MMPLTWFGHWQTWLLIAGGWVVLSVIVGLMMGAMCRIEDIVAKRRERRVGK